MTKHLANTLQVGIHVSILTCVRSFEICKSSKYLSGLFRHLVASHIYYCHLKYCSALPIQFQGKQRHHNITKCFLEDFITFLTNIYMKVFLFKETIFQRHAYSKFIPVTTEKHKKIVKRHNGSNQIYLCPGKHKGTMS